MACVKSLFIFSNADIITDTSYPSSPEMVLVLWGFAMALAWHPAKPGSGRQMSIIFPKI